MVRFFRLLAAAAAFVLSIPAQAQLLWQMNEIYSSPDGNIQFLEITALASNQSNWNGRHLVVTSGFSQRTITFLSDLPPDTTNRKILIATQGFADLNLVTPNFVVTNGFFFPEGGTLNFADGSDVWTYPALPTDARSLYRDGSTALNTPQNYNGETATYFPASSGTFNYQGLWYRAPAESEAGWGLNIAHQGDILFTTWFTYDLDGSQMWLVGPDVRRTNPTGNTYSGPLYRTRGPAFNSTPFPPSATSEVVGSITFTFADGSGGTMTTVVNGTQQSKTITRQVFGPMPTCVAGGTPGPTFNFTDLWYAAPAESEAGWGVNVSQQGDIIFITWFTYDATGKGMWIVGPSMSRTPGTNIFTGALYRTTGPAYNANPWRPSNVAATQVGNANLTFNANSSGTFGYTVNGISQTKNITRQLFGSPQTVCR